MYEKMLSEYATSAGSAMKENEVRLSSWESKVNQFTNAVSEMWNNTIDTDSVKSIMDFGILIVGLVDKIGLFKLAYFGLTTAILLSNKAFKSFLTSFAVYDATSKKAIFNTNALKISFTGLKTSMDLAKLSVIGVQAALSLGLSLAITAVVVVIDKLIGKYQQFREEQKEIDEQNQKSIETWSLHREEIEKLIETYERLSKIPQNQLSAEQLKELTDVQNQLNQFMPVLTKNIDENGNAHLRSADAIKQEIDFTKKLKETQDKQTVNKFDSNIEEKLKKLNSIQRKIKSIGFYPGLAEPKGMSAEDRTNISLSNEKKKINLQNDYNSAIDETISLIKEHTDIELQNLNLTDKLSDSQKVRLDNLINENKENLNSKDAVNKKIKSIQNLINAFGIENQAIDASDVGMRNHAQTIEQLSKPTADFSNLQSDLLTKFKETADEVSTLNKLYADLKDGKEITADQALELIKNEESLIDAFTIENGQIHLNIEAVEALIEAKGNGFNVMLEQKQAEVQAEIESTNTILAQYGKKIEAIKTYAEAQIALQSVIDNMVDEKGVPMAGVTDVAGKLFGRLNGILKAQETIDKLKGLAGASFKPGGIGTPSSKSSSSKEKDPYITDQFAVSLQALELIITQTEGRLSQLEQTSSKYRSEIEKLISLSEQKKKLYESEAKSLREQRKAFKEGSQEYDELTSRINQMSSSWWDAQLAVDKFTKSLKDSWTALADNLISQIKSTLNAQIDAIDTQMDKEQDRHKRRVDNIKEEKDAFNKAIDEQLKAIDRLNNTEDYDAQLSKAQTSKQDIQNKINVAMFDNSPEGKKRLADLQKQLLDAQEEIDKIQLNRQRELRKNNLQDQKEVYNEDAENLIESENDKFDAVKKSLDKQKKALQNQLNDEQAFANLRLSIVDGNLSSMNSAFSSFEDLISSNSSGIGKALQKNFISKLEDAKELLYELEELLGGETTSNKTATPPSGWTKSGTSYKKTMDGQIYAITSDGGVYKNNNYIPSGNYKYLPEEVLQVAKDRKAGYYKDGGLITHPVAIAGEAGKEAIFNMPQLNNLFDMLRNPFKYQIPKVNIPQFAGAGAGGSGAVNYNLNLNIENLQGTKQGANLVFKEIVTGLKKLGKM